MIPHTSITHKQNTLPLLDTRIPAWLITFILGLQVSTSASSLLFLLVVEIGIMQNVKYEMLPRKIDGEMNMQNCAYSRDGGNMFHD